MFETKFLNNSDFNAVFQGLINWLELWRLLGSHYHEKCSIFQNRKRGDLQNKTRNQDTKCKIKGTE